MPIDELIRILQQSFYVVLLVSAPVMATAFVVGLLVSAFQGASQLSDAAVGWVPKFLAGALVLWFAGFWMSEQVLRFVRDMWQSLLHS